MLVADNLVTDVFYPNNETSPLVEVTGKTLRDGVLMSVKGPFGKTEEKNKNDRIYTNDLWKGILGNPDIKTRLKERAIFGEADHPQTLFPAIQRVSHIVTSLVLDDAKNQVVGEADILDTPSGRIIKTIYDAGGKIGISSRGAGGLRNEGQKKYVDEEQYKFGGFDFVVEPSMDNAYPKRIQESVAGILTESIDEVGKDIGYYQGILKKVSPDGNVRLERLGGQLCVLHAGQNLMESSPDHGVGTTEENTPAPDTFGADKQQETNTFRPREEFLLERLQELRGAYTKLRKQRGKQAPLTEQTNPESASGEKAGKPTTDSLPNFHYQEKIESLRLEIAEYSAEITELQAQIIAQDAVILEAKKRHKALNSASLAPIEDSLQYKTMVEQVGAAKEQLDEIQIESSVTEKLVASLQEVNTRLKSESAKQKGAINKLKRESVEVHRENMALYLEYKASDLALDPDRIIAALPDKPSKDDVDRVSSLMVETRTSGESGGDLPSFSGDAGVSTPSRKVSIENDFSGESGKIRKRISLMIGQI